jgi:hypothetical protein
VSGTSSLYPITYHPCLPCLLSILPRSPFLLTTLAGTLTTTSPVPTSIFTTLPAPTTALLPILTPPKPSPQPQSTRHPQSQSASPPLLYTYRTPFRQQTHIRSQPHMPPNHHRRVVMDARARVSVKLPPDAYVDAGKYRKRRINGR